MKIDILGTNYDLIIANNKTIQRVAEQQDRYFYGLTDYENKKIYINKECDGLDFEETVRHEVIHAYFKESGLYTQADFALSELNVDWFAIQFPKMEKTFKNIGDKYGNKKEKANKRREQKEVLKDSSNDSNNT